MTDTSTLSGYLLDYYSALAEKQPSPCLRKHPHSDDYICIIGDVAPGETRYYLAAYSPTTNPELALPIIDNLLKEGAIFGKTIPIGVVCLPYNGNRYYGDSITEAALRALIAWKFPDGLPEPIYESEK